MQGPGRRDVDSLAACVALAATGGRTTGGCPEAEDMAAFAEGTLSPNERERMMAHLAKCPECRRELLAVQAIWDEEGVQSAKLADRGRAQGRFHVSGTDLLDGLHVFVALPVELDVGEGGVGLLAPVLPDVAQVQLQSVARHGARCPWCGTLGVLQGDVSRPFLCQSCGKGLVISRKD